jgi:hypothetical protein
MNVVEAMQAVKEGKRVQRKRTDDCVQIVWLSEDFGLAAKYRYQTWNGQVMRWSADIDDILDPDWEIYDE